MSEPITYSCGCVNRIDIASGVLRCESKCPAHAAQRRDPAMLDAAYYEHLGAIHDGKPFASAHVAELKEALGEFPPGDGRTALEIGCGASPYVEAIRAAGWQYVGLDLSLWAVRWLADTYGVKSYVGGIEECSWPPRWSWHFILAAHVFEHLQDAPGQIQRCEKLLASGGELWIIVPDDSDPVNEDHLWFFTAATLRRCVERAGLEVVREHCARRIERENFLYLRARKK